ncbi:RNA polymerase sigma factor [Filimonas effusa]|uniref:Sigma-70 family RNA polymerase sigma factor n=1 Tax=Filimonas effusa TaxID=2508721 RepID=A0A4Q1D574_9BACT|nr:sigma-70 family RNA polymerase sigma factor [Filimonas effusa]RXK83640.1 sigma-70 family RNA polymerase sigma factor [Filimonas effusa]
MIVAIKNGDEFAFEQAFLQLRGRLYGYFFKKTHSEQDAFDLVQTTFLKLWKYRGSLNEHYSLEQHLFRISKTVFIDYLRKKQKSSQVVALRSAESSCVTSEEFDLKSQVYKALDTMPEIRKKAFELHRFHGFTYSEISSCLSISVKSVDNHVTKAVRQLKKVISIGAY